jgi:hypothetical protein
MLGEIVKSIFIILSYFRPKLIIRVTLLSL